MSYRLGTLHLGTDFDQPIEPLSVPGSAEKGRTSALWMLDGASRAPRRLARLVRPLGLLGVKVADPGNGLRVSISMVVDDVSTKMWNRVHSEDPEDPILPDEFRQHRLVQISAQGRPRATVMLSLRGTDTGGVRQQVHFDVPAAEIGDSGLLMFSFEEPAGAPEWARRGLLENGLVGACVANVQVAPIPAEAVTPWASTGRPRRKKMQISPSRPGFFIVNAPAGDTPLTVRFTRRDVNAPDLPPGRRAKVKAPVRTLTGLSRRAAARAFEHKSVEVEVVGTDGATLLTTTLEPTDDGRYNLTLPAGTTTAFVRARVRRSENKEPREVDWLVRVTAGTRT